MEIKVKNVIEEVTVPVKIKLNGKYRIHPSQAFCGIEEGIVKVNRIIYWETLTAGEQSNFIDEYGLSYEVAHEEEGCLPEILVEYEYEDKKIYDIPTLMDIEMFVDHISSI